MALCILAKLDLAHTDWVQIHAGVMARADKHIEFFPVQEKGKDYLGLAVPLSGDNAVERVRLKAVILFLWQHCSKVYELYNGMVLSPENCDAFLHEQFA